MVLRRTVLVWIALELAAAAQLPAANGGSLLWSWLRVTSRPVTTTAARVGQTAVDLWRGVVSTRSLAIRTRTLREELDSCRTRLELVEEDLVTLRQAARLPVLEGEMADGAVAARCTFRNLGLGRMEVLAGGRSGVRTGTAVVGPGGLVGRVVRVEMDRCWVELITHPAAAVAVRSPDGQVQGLATGNGTTRLDVEFVPRRATLLRGSLLETSGADAVYPPGLEVARVSALRESDGPFLEVAAEPTARLADLRVVMLLPSVAASEPGGWGP
jgi:rod shape-determining protein MreC